MKRLVLPMSIALVCGAAVAANTAKDHDFAIKAAQGGKAEVDMGQLAASRASDPKVKEFGQKMATDHAKANDELQAVASNDGINLPDDASKQQKAAAEKLGKLQGADFDKEYAHMMVKDHEEDVALFKKEATSGSNPALKAYAQKTLPTLEEHLRMARELPAGSKASRH